MLLYQPQDGYRYNSDTHILYSFISQVLSKYKNLNISVLDVGAGVGVLGLLLKRDHDKLRLSCSEIQEAYIKYLKINLNINNQIANIYSGDFGFVCFQHKFDLIISNPPFYDKNVLKSSNKTKQIARYNDSLPLTVLVKKANDVLTDDGKLIFCYDAKQIDELFDVLGSYRFNIEAVQFVHSKPDKNAKIVLVYARKNSNSKTDVYAPIISFDTDGNTTKKIKDIYSKSNIQSIKAQFDNP